MKRSPIKPGKPLQRRAPLRAAAPAKAEVKIPNARKCKVCGDLFRPSRGLQTWCTPECGVKLAGRLVAKKEAKAKTDDKRQTRAALEALKTLKELRAEAQNAFNRFVKFRDRLAGHGCICCGAPLDWDSGKPGGSVDAGHYMSRGSTIELAFDERNVNAQRKSCNRPGGTTRAKFAAGMAARYGQAVVDELEGPHDLPQLRHDDLRAIRDTYRAKANALEKVLRASP